MTIPEIIRRADVLCAAAGIPLASVFVERQHKRFAVGGDSAIAVQWIVSVVYRERAAVGYGRRPSDALRDLRALLADPECPLRAPPPREATL